MKPARLLFGSTLLLAIATGGTFLVAFALPPGNAAHSTLICSFGLLGAFLAGLFLQPNLARPVRISNRHEALLAIAAAAALGLLIGNLGMRQFGGFDHSALIDLGWRLVQGQRPYRDFPCTMPVGFYLGAKYAFTLFGTFWQSLVLTGAVYAAVTFLWSLALLRELLPARRYAWILAFGLQATTSLITSYWWYNPVTTIAGVLFFLSALLLFERPQSWNVRALYLLSLTWLAMQKPNVAGLLIAGVTLTGLVSPQLRRPILALSAAAFACFLAVLSLHGIALPDLLGGYLSIASRGFSLNQLFQDLGEEEKRFSQAALLLCFGPLALMVRGQPVQTSNRALAAAAAFAGLYGFITNGELKLVDSFLILLGTVFWSQGIHPPAGNPLTAGNRAMRPLQFGTAVALLFGGVATGQAVTRHRVKAIGYGCFFEYQPAAARQDSGFFTGLLPGPIFQTSLQETAWLTARFAGAKFFFGPRMEWAYAAYGLPSPAGQPVWWHPGVSFPSLRTDQYLQRRQQEHFDFLVFLRNDFTYYSQKAIRMTLEGYVPVGNFKTLTVFQRQTPGAPAQ